MPVAAPSIAGDVAAGVKIVRRAYNGTDADLQATLRDIASRIREGGRTPSIRSMAGQALRDAGFPQGIRNQADALRRYVRSKVSYQPDPPMVEFVQSATTSLCTPDAKLCIPIGDCDDLVIALGSLMMASGLDVQCLIQDYGPEQQQHILLAFKDESGQTLTCDPSALAKPIGFKDTAVNEFWMDPLNPQDLKISAPAGEFVGVGRPKTMGKIVAPRLPPDPCAKGRCGFAPRVALVKTVAKKPCCSACAEGKPCTGCGSTVHPCSCETGDARGPKQQLGAPLTGSTTGDNVLGYAIIAGGAVGGYYVARAMKATSGVRAASAVAGLILGSIVAVGTIPWSSP